MGSPADEVYIQLKHAKQLCEYEYKLAFNSWDGKRVEQWHRCLNAVSAAMDAFLPLRESPLAEPAEITLEPLVDTPNSIGPLAETENMQWEIRPVVDYTAESHSVVVPRDDLVACLRRITKFRRKPARRERSPSLCATVCCDSLCSTYRAELKPTGCGCLMSS